jgi:hypothetical protein
MCACVWFVFVCVLAGVLIVCFIACVRACVCVVCLVFLCVSVWWWCFGNVVYECEHGHTQKQTFTCSLKLAFFHPY